MANLIPRSIGDLSHFAAFDDIAAARFGDLDIPGQLLTYLFDLNNASPEVLQMLAVQFGVDGYGGFALTNFTTDPELGRAQRIELLKHAIELHRRKGTPWAIREALRAVGFNDVQIIEGAGASGGATMNGAIDMSGATAMGDTTWATFSVLLDLGNAQGANTASLAAVQKMIEAYKPARCHLIDLSLLASLLDQVPAQSDSFDLTIGLGFVDTLASGLFMDGSATFDGAAQASQGDDILTFTLRLQPFVETVATTESFQLTSRTRSGHTTPLGS